MAYLSKLIRSGELLRRQVTIWHLFMRYSGIRALSDVQVNPRVATVHQLFALPVGFVCFPEYRTPSRVDLDVLLRIESLTLRPQLRALNHEAHNAAVGIAYPASCEM
jgi:hypothetical protein